MSTVSRSVTPGNTQADCPEAKPRIYVACLAAYNQGHLHGDWIDADEDDIQEEIQAMLADSPIPGAEEWAIHDHEGFEGLRLDEYESIERVAQLGQLIAEHGPAFAAYAGHIGTDYATEESFQEAYCGEWDSERAYAEDLFDELYLHDVPDHVQPYIDYDSFSRDLFISDNFSVDNPNGGVFVFRNI
jgi:antirestriction protein